MAARRSHVFPRFAACLGDVINDDDRDDDPTDAD
jgi:hypothetical protein